MQCSRTSFFCWDQRWPWEGCTGVVTTVAATLGTGVAPAPRLTLRCSAEWVCTMLREADSGMVTRAAHQCRLGAGLRRPLDGGMLHGTTGMPAIVGCVRRAAHSHQPSHKVDCLCSAARLPPSCSLALPPRRANLLGLLPRPSS
jgi:hypothetical protein